jgi:hypothetical protein
MYRNLCIILVDEINIFYSFLFYSILFYSILFYNTIQLFSTVFFNFFIKSLCSGTCCSLTISRESAPLICTRSAQTN